MRLQHAGVLLLAWWVACAPAHAEQVVFENHFPDLSAYTPHLLDTSGWSLSPNTAPGGLGNQACYNGSGHMQLAVHDPAVTGLAHYRASVRFMLPNGNNYPGGLRVGADPTTGAGFESWMYPGSSTLTLFKVAAWNIDTPPLVSLATGSASYTPTMWQTLVIEMLDGVITVTLDGTLVAQHALGYVAPGGAVALDVSTQATCFADLVVTALDGTPPPPPVDPSVGDLFTDDFTGGMHSEWLQSLLPGGTYTVTPDDTLLYSGGGHSQLYASGVNCVGDCELSVDMSVLDTPYIAGGIRWVSEGLEPGTIAGQGYALWVYTYGSATSATVVLMRVDGDPANPWHIDPYWTVLGSVPLPLSQGTPFNLALRRNGDTLEALVDGSVVLTATDATYTAGTIALDPSAYSGQLVFDNVRVHGPLDYVFADWFEDPAYNPFDPTRWSSSLGTDVFTGWSRTTDGYASFNGSSHMQVWSEWTGTEDYRADFTWRLPQAAPYIGGPCVRMDATTGKRYCAWVYPSSGEIKLLEAYTWQLNTLGTDFNVLASAPLGAITYGQDYPVSIEAAGDSIKVWWNTDLSQTPTMEAISTLQNSGGVGFDTSFGAVQYGDVTVTPIVIPPTPPVVYGSGGPILVLYGEDDPSAQYLKAILEGEGITGYRVQRIDTVLPAELAQYELVIVGEMTLTADQVAMLTNFAQGGGNLMALRPDPQLYPILGLTAAGTTTSEGYFLPDQQGLGEGVGLPGVTLQFHTAANNVTFGPDVQAIATLYSNASTATTYPAATLRYLTGGGSASAWMFNLPLSVIYSRQGNPAWVDQDRDCVVLPLGCNTLRSDDLFIGNTPGTDYVDFTRIDIPQTDELQRLFVNTVYAAMETPLPRNWYLPKGLQIAVVNTGDDHSGGGTIAQAQTFLALSPVGCSLADWECYRQTSYAYTGVVSPTDALWYVQNGFEFVPHLTTFAQNWTYGQMLSGFEAQIASWEAYYLPTLGARYQVPETLRTHAIAIGFGWATDARVGKELGIRFNTNFYYWPPAWPTVLGTVENLPGYMTGSGIPQEYGNIDGTLVDGVYQAHTHITDETATTTALMELHYGTLCSDSVANDWPLVLTNNHHTDHAVHWGTDAMVACATNQGAAIVTSKQMLDWLDGRNATTYTNVSWNGFELSFTATVPEKARNLVTMVPVQGIAAVPVVMVDGQTVPSTLKVFKGVQYVTFKPGVGSHTVVISNL